MADIPRSTIVSLAQYAGDTAISAALNPKALTIKHFQVYLYTLETWLTNRKITINDSKSAAMIISRRRDNIQTCQTLHIFKTAIPWNSRVKYLGIIIDQKLSWMAHIGNVMRKMDAAQYVLHPLICRHRNLHLSNKLLLYKSIIRPYGAFFRLLALL
jgi:hypothetical protein